MGREVRHVPADWQHPKDDNGRYVPLMDGDDYQRRGDEWDEGNAKWAQGLRDDYSGGWKALEDDEKDLSYDEWAGPRPYMPVWKPEEKTHIMMYEDTSEGTPISPAFKEPEELARWLTDNEASAFGSSTATYEQWLATVKAGWAVSGVMIGGKIMSGVEAMAEK